MFKNKNLFLCGAIIFASHVLNAQSIEKLLVISGGKFEFSPPFTDYVQVKQFNVQQGALTLNWQSEIKTQSVQDAFLTGDNLYVTAQDSLVKLNYTNGARLNAIADSGLKSVYAIPDFVFIGRQFPIKNSFASVLNNQLSIISTINKPNISGETAGMVRYADTLYLAVNGGYAGTFSKIALFNLVTGNFIREIDFTSTFGTGIDELWVYTDTLYALIKGSTSKIGKIIPKNNYSASVINLPYKAGKLLRSVGVSATMFYQSGYNNAGVIRYNTLTSIADTLYKANGRSLVAGTISRFTNHLYLTVSDYFSYGRGIVVLNGDSVGNFNCGISPEVVKIQEFNPTFVSEKPVNNLFNANVFPNPTDGFVQVSLANANNAVHLSVFSVNGSNVYQATLSESENHIDLSFLNKGIYMVRLTDGKQQSTIKLIVTH